MIAGETDLNTLPAGEREVLVMIAKQVLRAVSEAYKFRETIVEITEMRSLLPKARISPKVGWKIYNEKEQSDKILPELAQGDELKVVCTEIKEGTSKPPAHFTEDCSPLRKWQGQRNARRCRA